MHHGGTRAGGREADCLLTCTPRLRGIIATSKLKLSTEHAKSGKQSLTVEGRVWPNLPQIALEPRTRYLMEAWVKTESPDVEAFILGDLYEWSPHSQWFREQRTSTASGGEWQRVSLEFETPEWDPFVNVVFIAQAKTEELAAKMKAEKRKPLAWMDDFRLVSLE